MFHLTHKQLLEFKFWCGPEAADERRRALDYLKAFRISLVASAYAELWESDKKVEEANILEIGTGPYWGMLPHLAPWATRVAVDPLFPVYEAAGLLDERNGIRRIDEPFESWETNDAFDAILTANALDHGEMGFYLMVKMARMLKPGGKLYVHVHLRPPELVNLLHDHALTAAQLDQHLRYTDLIERHRKVYPKDVDGGFCETLVGIWAKPL